MKQKFQQTNKNDLSQKKIEMEKRIFKSKNSLEFSNLF